jgi:hypothetical protein
MGFIPIEYRILFIFSLIVAFILTERRFAFDMKDRLKIFGVFFATIYIGISILYFVLKSFTGTFVLFP